MTVPVAPRSDLGQPAALRYDDGAGGCAGTARPGPVDDDDDLVPARSRRPRRPRRGRARRARTGRRAGRRRAPASNRTSAGALVGSAPARSPQARTTSCPSRTWASCQAGSHAAGTTTLLPAWRLRTAAPTPSPAARNPRTTTAAIPPRPHRPIRAVPSPASRMVRSGSGRMAAPLSLTGRSESIAGTTTDRVIRARSRVRRAHMSKDRYECCDARGPCLLWNDVRGTA